MRVMRTLMAVALVLAAARTAAADKVPLPKVGSGDADKWLLDDAEVILVVNAKQMMGSKLMKDGGAAALKDAVKQVEQLKDIVEATGLDVTKDIDSLVASATTGTNPKTLIVVKGNFDTDKVGAAMKKKAEKTFTEGKQTVYQVKLQGNPVFGLVKDKNTIVLGHSKDFVLERGEKGGLKAAKLHKDMGTALKAFTGKESVAMVMLVTEELQKQFAQLPPNVAGHVKNLKTVTMAMTMTDGLAVSISGVTNDAKSAKQIAAQLDLLKATAAALLAGQEDLPPGLTDVLNAVKVEATKEAATINLKLSEEQIKKIGKTDN